MSSIFIEARPEKYCGISTDCSANVTRDGLEQMGPVFEIGVTV